MHYFRMAAEVAVLALASAAVAVLAGVALAVLISG